MDNLESFLADFPYKLFVPEEADTPQTAEQAKKLIQRAEAKKQRVRLKRLKAFVSGGWKHGA